MNFIRPVATFPRIIIWRSLDDFDAEAQFFNIFDVLITISYKFLVIFQLLVTITTC